MSAPSPAPGAAGTRASDRGTAPRAVVVWFPDWPIVAAGVARDVPAAVFHANRVVACSAAARYEGVTRNVRRREAQARCPDLLVLGDDPARDARAFEPVVAALEQVCPRVEIVRPGVAAFLARGPRRYFGTEEQVALRTRTAVASVDGAGASCLVGIADGRFAATLAAKAADEAGEDVRIVPRGETGAFLAPFPVGVLDNPELADLLMRLGVRTLGDLAALPAVAVLARFGVDGDLAARLARGEDERPLMARVPPDDLALTAELDPPADRADRAAFVAKALADQLHDELGRRGLACTRIAIEAETEHGEHLVRLWRHDGALTAGAIAERVRWQLDGWLTRADGRDRPTAGITLVRLAPDEVRPDIGRQLGFWGGTTHNDEKAARALARVQGMLGLDAVCTPVLGGGRSPGERVRLVPWGDSRGDHDGAPPPAGPPPVPPGASRAAPPVPLGASRPAPPVPLGASRAAPPVPLGAARAAPSVPLGAARAAPSVPPLFSPSSPSPWPGSVPAPAPAVVHARPVPAEVFDDDGAPVRVTARGLCSGALRRVSIGGAPPEDVAAWSGPWPVDERWWDPPAHRRRARFQVATVGGAAYLAAVEGGRWWIEATYD